MDETKDALLQSDQTEEVHEESVSEDPSDKLTPDHPRFKQVNQEKKEALARAEAAEQRLADLEAKINERQETTGDLDLTAEEQLAMTKITKVLEKEGYVKKSMLEEERRVETRANTLRQLRQTYNGKNGLPEFTDEVIAHAKRKGFGDNYEAAYKDMNFDAIVEVEARRRENGYIPPSSESPTSAQRVITEGLTPEQIADPNFDYEKYRDVIHKSMKERAKKASLANQ